MSQSTDKYSREYAEGLAKKFHSWPDGSEIRMTPSQLHAVMGDWYLKALSETKAKEMREELARLVDYVRRECKVVHNLPDLHIKYIVGPAEKLLTEQS